MVIPRRGSIVLVPFPFSDLSQSKLRPAVILASVGRGDWVLCQVTSNAYGDARAIQISLHDFAVGGLRVVSFVRPGKLFTAHETLLRTEAGQLLDFAFQRIRGGVLAVFE